MGIGETKYYLRCMNELRLALVQTSLHWEDAAANKRDMDAKLRNLSDVDVVFLPEMFTTGFSMRPSVLAETMEGETVQWMISWSKELNSVVTGSLIIEEDNQFFNRLIWAEPDGSVKTYDKRHRFSYAGEHEEYTAGSARPTWEYRGWKIRPQICYDLRFPAWARNDDNYDLLFYVANWPERRSYPWKSLLVARAIENMSYVVGLNRVGEDGNGIMHSGDSGVFNALGEAIAGPVSHAEEVIQVTIQKSHLDETRSRFGFLNDRDSFQFD